MVGEICDLIFHTSTINSKRRDIVTYEYFIPIGSDVAGIPDIIGEAGYILKKKNEEDLIELINNLSKSTITREEARDQIIANFPLSRRESEFLAHISHL